MLIQATETCSPYLDHATYVSPVCIKATRSHGRDLFTTKEAKAGDFLLRKKAFAFSFVTQEESVGDLVLMINSETNEQTMPGQAALLETLVQMLRQIEASEVDGSPVIDTQLVSWNSNIHLLHEQSVKAAEFAVKTLHSLGFEVKGSDIPHVPGTALTVDKRGLMVEDVINFLMTLSHAYHLVARNLVPQALAFAKIAYKICIGEDETFAKTYEENSS
ncbi:hypothetical protein TSTA_051480 [Talaromyces stipitatus ATCC 10500]|uniref:Uncharacterized protein n=1 Tax=Talaromyces stipitatus (strain ATCC 10500 / CBS 375.48 / QM 6759 / NRRL 1006) TaxID=441959 RepID=B8MJ50_TALSN|nr:uncharacterized protein TSTA_051480 [Talaromyces stipitatus ATCC 10500]EED15712.1 hypothetical protein TSTA_051480 [Talaromyces stipitatus ATCC 10500]